MTIMSMLNFIILGIIQGLTEFLPISSSGHLILARHFFDLETPAPLAVDAILQLGTIVAVYIYFAPELTQLTKDFFKGKRNVVWGIILGSIPALIVGLLTEEYIDTYLRNPVIVASVLIIGALLFLLVEKLYARGTQAVEKINLWQSLKIGLAQCLAFIPGFSRSGATIMAGMTQGLTREAAARFSFYLSLPIITISGLKKLYDITGTTLPDGINYGLALGTLVSFITGLLCIHFLLTYLKRHSLNGFALYRITIGVLALLSLFI